MKNFHYETIICPHCNAIELTEVSHTFPKWTYHHKCIKCDKEIDETNWNTNGWLWNEDMMDVLFRMKSNNENLVVITDPPYGVRKKEEWDETELFKEQIKIWIQECLRVTGHTVVWFCASKMLPYIFANTKPINFFRQHFWNKPKGSQFAGASNNRIWYSVEPILIFTKDVDKTKRNFDEDSSWNYDALEYNTVPSKTWKHPTIKPLGLITQLVLHYTKSSDTILDPFGGSGTLAEVAIKTGRRYIIIEKDEKHFNTILNRIKNINAQTNLFGY
jgi:DNA modification methylase